MTIEFNTGKRVFCTTCPKRNHSLLSDLVYKELEILESHRQLVHYDKGETIYKAGTNPMGLLCLSAGKAKIVRVSHSGQEQIVALKKPVDFIGFRALVGGDRYTSTAIALEDSSVCIIDQADFNKVLTGNMSFALKIVKMMAKELDEAEFRRINLTQKHLRARLADALLQIADVFGLEEDERTLIAQLKRSDIAALSNMTTANVIRTLSAMNREGIIKTQRKKIIIQEMEQLQSISIAG